MGARSWGFFDAHGFAFARGWQGTEEQARRHARSLARDAGESVEYIDEQELCQPAGDDWTVPEGEVVQP